jgi:hypothetical protein
LERHDEFIAARNPAGSPPIIEAPEKGHGMSFAQPNFDDLRARSRSFDALAQYSA